MAHTDRERIDLREVFATVRAFADAYWPGNQGVTIEFDLPDGRKGKLIVPDCARFWLKLKPDDSKGP
jgi:hypothetical protein